MKNIKAGLIAVTVMAVGGTIFVSSTFAGPAKKPVLEVIRHPARTVGSSNSNMSRVRPISSSVEVDQKLLLVPPPAELPQAPSSKMVTSVKTFAPAPAPVAAKNTSGKIVVTQSPRQVQARAAAQKTKPENLFSYVRLLNYAPHPLTEEFLKKSPLSLNGKNYWFSVKYDEDWKVVGDEEGYIDGISFERGIMENEAKVRSLKTPKVKIDPKTLKKGMVLGIAEVAPYKFTIKVEEFTRTKKGVSELVFKLDLLG
jgi:hypothetical protein